MPTPFTHLAYAHHWLNDPRSPSSETAFAQAYLPDFLLGSVAADARVPAKDSRAATHFYTYTAPMKDHPWRVMLGENPSLACPDDEHLRAFVAGYAFHLAMDEYWSNEMLAPQFAFGTWHPDRTQRFYVLHLLLISMDERDRATLPPSDVTTLPHCHPHHWLPFMSDDILTGWRDFIASQILGESKTLEIFGGRINQTPAQLRPVLDSKEQMHELLYQHLTPSFLADFESRMYDFASEQLSVYLRESR
jgi:hypothetical protein